MAPPGDHPSATACRRRPPGVILDIATSRWRSQDQGRPQQGRPAPEGALLDPRLDPTTDPAVMFAQPMGALLAVSGEHKGSGWR